MELTIGIILSIISCIFVIATFVVNRKDKSNKDTSNGAYAQGRIEEKLANIEKSLTKIEDKLDNYESDIKKVVKEEMNEHILQYHQK